MFGVQEFFLHGALEDEMRWLFSFPQFRYELQFYLSKSYLMSSAKGVMMNERRPLFQDVHILPMPVFASFPSPADDYKEPPLSLNDLVIYHPVATYFARVSGDSMIGACIYPNDVVVVDKALTAANNRIVVARVGEELTIKRLQIIGRKTFLKPENPSYTSIEVKQGDDWEIWGVVTWVVHQLVHYKTRSEEKGR